MQASGLFGCQDPEGQAAVPFPEREEPTDCASCLPFGIWIKGLHFVMIKVQKEYFTKIGSRNFQEAESGIEAGQHLEKRGNGSKGVQERSVICGLEIPRGYVGHS